MTQEDKKVWIIAVVGSFLCILAGVAVNHILLSLA